MKKTLALMQETLDNIFEGHDLDENGKLIVVDPDKAAKADAAFAEYFAERCYESYEATARADESMIDDIAGEIRFEELNASPTQATMDHELDQPAKKPAAPAAADAGMKLPESKKFDSLFGKAGGFDMNALLKLNEFHDENDEFGDAMGHSAMDDMGGDAMSGDEMSDMGGDEFGDVGGDEMSMGGEDMGGEFGGDEMSMGGDSAEDFHFDFNLGGSDMDDMGGDEMSMGDDMGGDDMSMGGDEFGGDDLGGSDMTGGDEFGGGDEDLMGDAGDDVHSMAPMESKRARGGKMSIVPGGKPKAKAATPMSKKQK